MFTYCTCGYKNEYSTTKPKFCGDCTKPLDAAFHRPATASVQPTFTPRLNAYAVPPQPQRNEIDPLDLIDPNSVRVDGVVTQKLTIGSVRELGDVTFERPSDESFGEAGKMSDLKRDAMKDMLKPMVSTASQEPQPARRTRRKKSA